ncbi:hypothetical protein [Pectobacterium quasiaquaticum]|nr:hypothetical protein [Pectobacterium quasiaquaticum]
MKVDAGISAARDGGHTVEAREGTPGLTAEVSVANLCAALF